MEIEKKYDLAQHAFVTLTHGPSRKDRYLHTFGFSGFNFPCLNGSVQPVKHHTLTEYGHKVTASTVASRPISESSGGSLIPSSSSSPLHRSDPLR
ncbi:hypothetical protein EVAR_6419_1 [Eumeta japonica]|uniref:Uncharacterized protein n=1 Tax=Eumeta variegata TaxID=151549 RepID=A0A4C1TF94_EUMVA|nr:hypothetical protein EVAR_6419_1 [Eumeta japonica]